MRVGKISGYEGQKSKDSDSQIERAEVANFDKKQ
jgi:hypothetical protein